MGSLDREATKHLAILARTTLGLSQGEFAKAVLSSLRTVSRWENGRAAPIEPHFERMAARLWPAHPEVARRCAEAAGKTLEELGLVAPPPAEAAGAAKRAAEQTTHLVDAVVYAAARAIERAPGPIAGARAAVLAAFSRATELRVAPEAVIAALAEPEA